jgi:hypothetical protein
LARVAARRAPARQRPRPDDYVTDGKGLYLVLAEGANVAGLEDDELLVECQVSYATATLDAGSDRVRVVGRLG